MIHSRSNMTRIRIMSVTVRIKINNKNSIKMYAILNSALYYKNLSQLSEARLGEEALMYMYILNGMEWNKRGPNIKTTIKVKSIQRKIKIKQSKGKQANQSNKFK